MKVYVTLTCGYGRADTVVRYAGTDKEKAYSYSKSDSNIHYYVWVETWQNGKKIKEEDV